jgi:hypothetical protein
VTAQNSHFSPSEAPAGAIEFAVQNGGSAGVLPDLLQSLIRQREIRCLDRRLPSRRGMRAPVLAVGDGALGFWKAVRDVFPETAEQRCWWHKIGNVGVAFKLIESAQARWRAVNAPHLVALVRAGAKFENGKLIERPESDDESQAA